MYPQNLQQNPNEYAGEEAPGAIANAQEDLSEEEEDEENYVEDIPSYAGQVREPSHGKRACLYGAVNPWVSLYSRREVVGWVRC